MRLSVSPNIMKTLKELFKVYDKPLPLIKYKLDPRLKPGDVVILKGSPTSIKVRVEDIKEYMLHQDGIPYDELRLVYGDKIKEIINNRKINKIYVIYVKAIYF